MLRLAIAVLLALGIVALPCAARAEPPATHRSWYGYQTLLVDGAAVAVYALGATSNNFALGAAGGGAAYVAGAPVCVGHLVHHNSSERDLARLPGERRL